MKRVLLAVTAVAAFGAVALASGGCDWFEDPTPEFVRVTVDGDAESMMLITSTQFFATIDPSSNPDGIGADRLRVEVLNSDTTHVTFPFDHSWSIAQDHRFLLLGFPSDSTQATVRLRVFVDEELDYDRSVVLDFADPAQYVYMFNQRILQTDFDVL